MASSIAQLIVYIIIPAYNRKLLTLACLESLYQQSYQSFSVLVVDDGSTDGTSDAIFDRYPQVSVLQGDGSLWWTGAIKLGMEFAHKNGADYIIWLNDDCHIKSAQTIENLVTFGQSNPRVIVGCQGIESASPQRLAFGGKRRTWRGYRLIESASQEMIPCDLLSGNLVCMPSSVIPDVGYPDVQNTPHYGGDSLFLVRAKKKGYELFLNTKDITYNIGGLPSLYPDNWLLCEGSAFKLIELAFLPRSGLSWRVWWYLNWESFGVWGIIMFSKKFLSILLLTFLRFLPFSLRKQLCRILNK